MPAPTWTLGVLVPLCRALRWGLVQARPVALPAPREAAACCLPPCPCAPTLLMPPSLQPRGGRGDALARRSR